MPAARPLTFGIKSQDRGINWMTEMQIQGKSESRLRHEAAIARNKRLYAALGLAGIAVLAGVAGVAWTQTNAAGRIPANSSLDSPKPDVFDDGD